MILAYLRDHILVLRNDEGQEMTIKLHGADLQAALELGIPDEDEG